MHDENYMENAGLSLEAPYKMTNEIVLVETVEEFLFLLAFSSVSFRCGTVCS